MLNRGELEGRFDPFFYIPELVALERKVWEKGAQPLRRFIHRMASGATPTKAEEEKFYSTKEQGGIPFVRVQNIKETSELVIDDLKYINDFTHNEYLKRSQVNGGDLLTKITGVGRMGVSAVAPTDFKGNINQHIVVSKTKDYETSEVLAAYLNSDLGEKLASRRATGGTRPALDYPALRSIPIVFAPAIIEILTKAVARKRQQEAQAQALLDSIDGYLLGELGITLPPKPENTIENRMFKTSWQQVSGGRFDPTYHQENIYGPVAKTQYEMIPLRKLVEYFKTGFAAGRGDQDLEGNGIIQIRPTNMSSSRELIFDKNVRISPVENEDYSGDLLIRGEVLFNNTNSQELVGKTVYFDIGGDYFCSNHITRIKTNKKLNGEYLTHLFNLYQRQQVFFKSCINWNNQSGINTDILRGILIPVLPIDLQERIAHHINIIRQQAQMLRRQAQDDFARAKQEIERLILG